MDSQEINKAIRETVRPVLKSLGFTKFTPRDAWRIGPTKIDVVNFQSFNSYLADCLGCTTYSFSVNLGCWFQIESREKLPKEYQCHFRGRLSRSIDQPELQRRDIWYIDPAGNYLGPSLSDVSAAIKNYAVPWFDRLENLNEVLHLLESVKDTDELHGPGGLGSPNRMLLMPSIRRLAAKSVEGGFCPP